jgi:hypothetical protein
MAQIQELRTLAFRFPPEATQLKHSCRSLAFPPRWLEMIEELKAIGKRLSTPRYYSPRDKSLYQLPLALFGQLITGDAPRPNKIWLRSTTDIEAEHLQMVFATWFAAEYNKLKIPLPANVEEDIYAESLEWQSEEHDLLVTNRNMWGTASPANNKSYEMLPELIADTLSHEGMTLDFHSQTLEFRRAPCSGNGVELISWPPLRWRTLHPESAYSIYLKFTLQTVPYQSFPTLHCDIGIRRWVSAQNADLGSGHHSVYMLANFPGAGAKPQTQRFQISSVGWKRLNAPNDLGRMYEPYWDNDLLPELFARIYPPGRLPEPESIRREPLDFLERRGLSFAIPVHNTMTPRQNRVQPGWTPVDRSILAEQIAHHLEQKFNLIYTPAPRRVGDRSSSSGKNVFLDVPQKQKGEGERQAKRFAVARAVNGRLKLEMWQQSDVVRDAIIASVVEMLGLGGFEKPRRCNDCYLWISPELTVELRTRPLDKFADPLDTASRNDLKRAIWRRAENIMRVVGGTQARSNSSQADTPVGAFVELHDASNFDDIKDPKLALRAGFAQVGRVTQFITPVEEGVEHRAKMSVMDLLRQLGVQSGLPVQSPKMFLRPTDYAAVWLYKTSKGAKSYLPMLLYMKADGSGVWATAYGLNGLLPYPEFLRRLTDKDNIKFIPQYEKAKIPGIFRDWVGGIQTNSDLVLFAYAQNTREAWGWLTDTQIGIDDSPFGINEQHPHAAVLSKVRVIRVRDSERSETPECFAQRELVEGMSREAATAFTQGVFQVGERVFYSLARKPKQRKNLSPKASKAQNLKLQAWNPRIVEFTVARKCEGDDPLRLAMLGHKLREAAVHTDDPMKLPLPLTLLEAAAEYAEVHE